MTGMAVGAWLTARRAREHSLDDNHVWNGLMWAIFVNNELYGAPTHLPWAIQLPPKMRIHPYEQYTTFHPLFLYESLWNLLTAIALIAVERRYSDRLRDGDLTLLYLMSYATIR